MAVRACTVSLRGVSGIRHSVDVDAESVYEAGIRGIALLRKDGWSENLAAGTEIEVRVREPEKTHVVTVGQLHRWCDRVTVSPAETIRKARLKEML